MLSAQEGRMGTTVWTSWGERESFPLYIRRASWGKGMHTLMTQKMKQTRSRIQATSLTSSPHGTSFVTYLSPQLSLRTVVPAFHGTPALRGKRDVWCPLCGRH